MVEYKYYEAPIEVKFEDYEKSIFLAGSITGAIDWQRNVASKLLPYYNVINPRRYNFDATDKRIEEEQITWEYNQLMYCDNILFWFDSATLAPITLFEYGKELGRLRSKDYMYRNYPKLFVGVHPDYKRKNDVLIQTKLVSQELASKIVFSLDELIEQIIPSKWY